MPGARSKPEVSRNQSCLQLFRKNKVGSIVRRKIIAQLPNST